MRQDSKRVTDSAYKQSDNSQVIVESRTAKPVESF